MELYKALRSIIEQNGPRIIGEKVIVNILDDYKGYEEAKGLKNILRDFIENGYSQKLLDIGGVNDQMFSLLSRFVHNTGYNQGLSNYLLDSLIYGLSWTQAPPELNLDLRSPVNSFAEIKHIEFRGVPLGIKESDFIKGIEKVGFKKEGDHYIGYFHGEPDVDLYYFKSIYTGNVLSLTLNIRVKLAYWDWHKKKYDKLVEDFSKKYKLLHNWSFYLADYSENDSDERKFQGLKESAVQVTSKFENDYGIVYIDMRAGSIDIMYIDNFAAEEHKEGVGNDL